MLDADIEFHRYLNSDNLTRGERERHPGKLDLETIDRNLGRHLGTIKKLINDMFARNAQKIETASGSVTLHLDYIAKPKPPVIQYANAIAFSFKGFFFVGLTYDLIELMNEICGLVAQSRNTGSYLGIKAETPAQREMLFGCLFLVQIQFASVFALVGGAP